MLKNNEVHKLNKTQILSEDNVPSIFIIVKITRTEFKKDRHKISMRVALTMFVSNTQSMPIQCVFDIQIVMPKMTKYTG